MCSFTLATCYRIRKESTYPVVLFGGEPCECCSTRNPITVQLKQGMRVYLSWANALPLPSCRRCSCEVTLTGVGHLLLPSSCEILCATNHIMFGERYSMFCLAARLSNLDGLYVAERYYLHLSFSHAKIITERQHGYLRLESRRTPPNAMFCKVKEKGRLTP